jgi:hypothetical protein
MPGIHRHPERHCLEILQLKAPARRHEPPDLDALEKVCAKLVSAGFPRPVRRRLGLGRVPQPPQP